MRKLIVIIALLALALAESELASYKPSHHNSFPRKKASYFSANAVLHGKFKKVSLTDYTGKYLVMLFYPFDFTYVCPTELIAFSDKLSKFKELNADVIAISTDSHFTHLAWTKTPRNEGGVGDLDIPLLADISKAISRNYGVLVEDETDELFGAALRGLFILDDKGVIRSVQINDAAVGRSVDEALRLVQAFQYADSHGEVCPANWKPGSDTIKPDQELKMEYFERTYQTTEL